MTLKEFLKDYATEETVKIGEALIESETVNVPNPKTRQILLDNLENTFVTPVFDGSARLREAAGELIERVVKRARLKKAADDEFYDTLYKEVNALKHLDEIDKNTEELGPLPTESKLLLFTLLTTWGILGGIFIVKSVKKRKTAQKS